MNKYIKLFEDFNPEEVSALYSKLDAIEREYKQNSDSIKSEISKKSSEQHKEVKELVSLFTEIYDFNDHSTKTQIFYSIGELLNYTKTSPKILFDDNLYLELNRLSKKLNDVGASLYVRLLGIDNLKNPISFKRVCVEFPETKKSGNLFDLSNIGHLYMADFKSIPKSIIDMYLNKEIQISILIINNFTKTPKFTKIFPKF